MIHYLKIKNRYKLGALKHDICDMTSDNTIVQRNNTRMTMQINVNLEQTITYLFYLHDLVHNNLFERFKNKVT